MSTSTAQLPYFGFYVDVFGFCNLRCPSCPVGNVADVREHFTKGVMSQELLDAILTKANRECQIGFVALFNWSEPLLHPNLPALIRTVRDHGNPAWISSNLNRLPDPDALMAAAPDFFRVSLSGFRQGIYEVAHRRGNIEAVKRNMERLAAARDRINAKTLIEVLFHRYNYNSDDEGDVRFFSEALGFEFKAVWAMYMPVEKILSMVGDETGGVETTAEDRAMVSTLSIDLREALALCRQDAPGNCALLDHYVVLDVNGDVFLCCGITSAEKNRIGHYLDMDIEEIQSLKSRKTICHACMGHGIHHYFLKQDSFSHIAHY
jgi:sulfatase maturation enzyme AslB (radical SAM superfamily)